MDCGVHASFSNRPLLVLRSKDYGVFPETIIELIDDGRQAIRPVIFKSKEILLDFVLTLDEESAAALPIQYSKQSFYVE